MTVATPAEMSTMVPLGDLCRFTNGGTPSKKEPSYWDNGDIPWITSTEIQDGQVAPARASITRAGLENSAASVVSAGTLLLVTRTGVGKTAIAPYDLTFSQDITAITPKDGRLDTRYLFRFLSCQQAFFDRFSRGATIKGLTRSALNRLEIPLPPLEEQRRIAAILDKADAIRHKRRQALQLTDTFLRSVFLDMFGEPVANPKGWDHARLEAVGEVQGGLQVTTKRDSNPVEVPYLRVANVFRDHLSLDEIKLMRVSEKELERVRLRRGDVLVVEGHGNKQEIGRSSVWTGDIDPCVHQNHLIRVRPNPQRVLPEFVSAYLNTEGGRRQMFAASNTTSGLNTISTSAVKRTQVIIPPLTAQRRFVAVKSRIANTQGLLSRAAEGDEHLFDSLIQRAYESQP